MMARKSSRRFSAIFLSRTAHALGAVNSINWARVLAQVVYYFYAWGRVQRATGCKDFYVSVPTGNFGDIFAGWVARQMGLPIRKLILATNENNILSRFVRDGDYSVGAVTQTLSPSMDIQVASNFERYLYYFFEQDPARVRQAMEDFRQSGKLDFSSKEEREKIDRDFLALTVGRDQTLATIRRFLSQDRHCSRPAHRCRRLRRT